MAVVALKPYVGEVRDRVENFHGNQLLYIGWEDHLMIAAPLAFLFPPTMRFGDVIENALPSAFGVHPEWEKIEWNRVEWFKSGQVWQPDFNKSLAENGLKHKDVLRFRTPGLTGIKGTCS